MATNKHATIRYNALDQCFNNIGRRYFIEDLVQACNSAIYEYTGTLEGVKKRQVYEDIKFMESEQGWSVELKKNRDGRKVFYRYTEKNFSIKNQALNETEVKQLKETLTVLNRFKGMPQFDWVEEINVRLQTEFQLENSTKKNIEFEQNPYLKGLNWFSELFNAIQYKKVLKIKYQGFRQAIPAAQIIHPYYLKQYNNRWFLFGFNEKFDNISNFSLDRIIEIEEIHKTYIENTNIDFSEYFEDVVGVTVKKDKDPEKILLKIEKSLFPYIESKPIHGSQKTKENTIDFAIIELLLQVNYEFISLILSFGEHIEIVEPENLKTIIKLKAEKILEKYL